MDKVKLKLAASEFYQVENFCNWYLNNNTPAKVRVETMGEPPHLRVVAKLMPALVAKLLIRLAIVRAKGKVGTGSISVPIDEALALEYAWTAPASYRQDGTWSMVRNCVGQIDKQYA